MSFSSATCISSPTPSPSSSHEMVATPNNSHTGPHLAAISTLQSSNMLEPTTGQSPSLSDSEPFPESESSGAMASALADVDPQIVEALKSKDRIYVLKLGEQLESLINDRRPRIDLTPNTSYQRLLVHRCSAYYKLAPETDPITKVISVALTLESRVPARRIAELVPAQLPTHPTIKIMRRSLADRQRSKPHSQAGSVAGEDAELSDVEPSEAGSLGGRSNATGSSKKHKTIAEREAAYNEARSRIFMDFEEKEKEKDLSASSSTVSLTSGSVTSAGETSSTGDLDDSVSSPTTESEWSGPVVRDKKDGRRSNGSSRSLRSNVAAFNGSNSSRGSRAPSPSSFKYPTLYEPSPAAAPYDLSQPPVQAPGYGNPYLYAYPQAVPPAPNYVPPYPFYAPYPYPHPQTPMHNSDPGSHSTQADVYTPQQHPPHHGVYVPYAWHSPPNQQHQPPGHSTAQHQSHPAPSPPIAPPASQYPTYTPPVPAYGPYPMPYYPSPPPMHHMQTSPSPVQNHAHYSPEYNAGHETYSSGRPYPGVIGQQSPTTGFKPRGAPPARSAWSYGPGVGMGGFGMNGAGGRSGGGGEIVGPRLSPTVRRHPGNSNASPGGRTLPGDEASSSASSSTSSSSRRTFTSTISYPHPLPARPDWAVGLKPQPTLHSTHRHHDHSMNLSPARHNGQRGQQVPPPLQSTDFPPLNSMNPAAEKRMPVAGVWNNSTSTRSILTPGNNTNNVLGTAPVTHSNPHTTGGSNHSSSKPEECECTPERLPGKGGIELFSPKGVRRPGGAAHNRSPAPQTDKDMERLRGEVVADAILVDKVTMLSLEGRDGGAVSAAKGVMHVVLAT
ncbi:hypothetical protein PAXRUDRAFT_826398 [Paxillus rubicundulus Ve08.2h10]|uniref:SUZ domain-containing protein n=1 Tax=Paxillus rubicundulus Ve08.2h10 TaxID=930991 RepID=A0A0D0E4F5_9AGAM|nr:hypothetical protein PAXRUDRAFT_826398 [Paxillus rubicundulus Ve08.2h10]